MERTVKLSETNGHPTATQLPLGAGGRNSPGFLFCFHSREFHVVIESQHRVHKEKKQKRETCTSKNFSEDPYIYISFFFFFVKALREGEKESNKMYRNKLAGHAN